MKSLKEKTIQGVFWSFIQNFSSQIIALIIGIVLARFLTPREFGLVGMLTIFIALSKVLIDSGMIDALIRNPDCQEKDYSTAFYFNIAISLTLYIILFLCGGWISNFYEEPQLKLMVRVLSLTLIINALTLIQKAKLIKEINFKLMTKIDVIAVLSSGLIAIGMAWYGFGVWSLVAKTLMMGLFSMILYWSWSKWTPALIFNRSSFKSMFSFGSRLAILGVIDTIFINIYYLIIGKVYSADQLGFYTQAERFKNFPSKGVTGIVQNVTYPILSTIQDNPVKLRSAYQKLVIVISFITITLLFGLSAVSENLIVLLLGEEWRITGEYLKILSFSAVFYPLNALNMNIMKVKGRSGLLLKIGLIKKILVVPLLVIAILFNIKAMLVAMIVQQSIIYYINTYYGGNLISYNTKEQLRDILPSIFASIFMYIVILFVTYFLEYDNMKMLIIQILTGAVTTIIIHEIFHIRGYLYIKNELLNIIKTKK